MVKPVAITLRVPRAFKARVKREADLNGMSLSTYVRWSLTPNPTVTMGSSSSALHTRYRVTHKRAGPRRRRAKVA
jgi:hypothetical protein